MSSDGIVLLSVPRDGDTMLDNFDTPPVSVTRISKSKIEENESEIVENERKI